MIFGCSQGHGVRGPSFTYYIQPIRDEVADVDVEIIPDVSNVGYVEPISVSVPAASSRVVNFVLDQKKVTHL